MSWICKKCKSENPNYVDYCIGCSTPKDFDPDAETKMLPAVKVEIRKERKEE